MPPSQPFKKSSQLKLGRISHVTLNSTTCTRDCLSTLRPLWSWNPQLNEPVSPFFLQSFYGLFLLSFRTQPDVLQNARSTYHLIYSVTLDYSDRLVFRLLTRAPFQKPQTHFAIGFTLSYFRSLFIDYKPPIHPHWANHMFQYIVEGLIVPLTTNLRPLWGNLTFSKNVSLSRLFIQR